LKCRKSIAIQNYEKNIITIKYIQKSMW
jgi:hypothetical protein